MNNKAKLLTTIILLGLLTGCGSQGEPTAAPSTAAPAVATSIGSRPTATVAAAPTVPPTPAGPQAIVVDVINQVDAHALPGGMWETALENMVLYLGGEVWAQEGATARVEIGPDLVRVAPNTIFSFVQPDANTMQLNLQEGQIWLNIEGLDPDEEFDVQTPSAVASVRGTRFSVRVAADGSTIVSSRADTVTVSSAAGAVTVTAGQQTDIAPGLAPSDPMTMTVEEQARWGMAAGAGLDVVAPVVGEPVACFTFPLYAGNPRLSPQGDWLTFTLYDYANHSSVNKFYDLQAGEFFTPSIPADAYVAFNPAGDSWAYSYYDNVSLICTAALDGSDTVCAGGDGRHYGWPTWSPDGEWVLFYGTEGSGQYNLFKLDRGGTEMTQLTFSPEGYDVRQTWSPDSEQIAYVHAPEYNAVGDLWVIAFDGSNPQRVFEGVQGGGGRVAWSPDGDWLAVPAATGEIWLLRPDGSESHQVVNLGPGEYYDVSWSPTPSGWPMFFKFYDEEGRSSLHYLTGDGHVPGYYGNVYWNPPWSADGSRMVFGDVEEVDPVSKLYRSEFCVFQALVDFWP